MPLRIEPAQPEQAEEIAALIREAFAPQAAILGVNPQDHPYYASFETAENVVRRMARGVVAVAYDGEKLAGTISYEVDPEWMVEMGWSEEGEHFGWIERLAVLPEFRGHGFGEELMAWAEAQLAAQGLRRIRLAIVAQFDRLEAFYERQGYKPARKDRHEPYPYDILFMEKQLEKS